MRVLITLIPGFGHLCPIIPLALALKNAGHDVALATSASIDAYVARLGLELLPSGPVWLESEFCHDLEIKEIAGPHRRGLTRFMEGEVVPKLFADLIIHVNRWKPNVILSNDYEVTGRTVAEIFGIPFVLLSSGPRLSRQTRQLMHAPLTTKLRKHAGLGTGSSLDYSLHWLHLCFSPEWYQFLDAKPYRPAENEYGIKPVIFDDFEDWQPAEDTCLPIENGKPKVLCTLGTVFNKDGRLVQRVIEGVADGVAQLKVLSSHTPEDAAQKGFPESVAFLARGVMSNELSGMDYVISHGGTSSLVTTLLQGIPSLLLPQGADQMLNAIVCNQHRLGIALMNAVLEPIEDNTVRPLLTGELVKQAFQQLVDSEEYGSNCLRFRESCLSLPGNDLAVELIEELAITRQPVTRRVVY